MTVQMRLLGSVGQDGMNRQADVASIQMLLNAYLESSAQPNRLNVSGSMDAATIAAIKQFQLRIVNLPEPDGRVDPHGPTLRKLLNRPAASGRRPLPSFQTLWKSYPTIQHPCDQGYANQCAIRMSVALIGAGFGLTGYRDPQCRHGHARGAESLAHYLARVVTIPRKAKKEMASKMCRGNTGLAFFRNIEGFRNSQGDHIDLWNGSDAKGDEYFMECEETWFWNIS